MIVQLLSRYLCIDNTNQQNTTINVYTLFVATIYVITLDNKAGEISFQDPIYAYWLKTEYFAK